MQLWLSAVVVFTFLSSLNFINTSTTPSDADELHDVYEDYLAFCEDFNITLQLPFNIEEINKNFITSPKVKCLTIENSDIRRLDGGVFDQMPNLWYLNLRGNRIDRENLFSFGSLSNLRKLTLNSQRSSYNYDNRVTVRGLYPELLYLNLKDNGIYSIYNEWSNPFPKLKYIDLSINQIESFSYTSLGTSTNLSWLVLDNNKIRSIGKYGLNLLGFTNLKRLSVANNLIDTITIRAFTDTFQLEYLNISNNLLSTIYIDPFRSLNFLRVLILDHNSIEDISEMPSNLTTLSINCNRIKNISLDSLLNLSHLKSLSLSGNMIQLIEPDAFKHQKMLEELNLSNNKLNYLPENWDRNMMKLRYLNLAKNMFTSLESIYILNISLLQIYFDQNPLQYINASSFNSSLKFVTIYLNSNMSDTISECNYRTTSDLTI